MSGRANEIGLSTLCRLVRKFDGTGNFRDLPRPERQKTITEIVQENIMLIGSKLPVAV